MAAPEATLHDVVQTETALGPLKEALAQWECLKAIDAVDDNGHTALALAVFSLKYEYVECLLEAGADPDVPLPDEEIAVPPHDDDECALNGFSEPPDPKITLLQWACRTGDERLFALLLQHKADAFAEAPAHPWRTALGLLVRKKHFEMAKQLLHNNRDMADLLINQNPRVVLDTVTSGDAAFLEHLLRWSLSWTRVRCWKDGGAHGMS